MEGYVSLQWPIHTYEQREKVKNSFEKIFHFGRVFWILKGQIYRTSYNNSFSENISLWEGVLVLKGQYIHTSRENKQQNSFGKIFHFGRVRTDLTESHCSRPVPVGLLDSTGGRGALTSGLCGQLSTRSLSSCRFTSSLLGTCHCEVKQLSNA